MSAMPRQALPAAPPVEESRLRSAPRTGKLHMLAIPSKERGVMAAREVLQGTRNRASAQEHFLVTNDQLRYWEKKLLEQGLPDKRGCSPSSISTPGSGYTDLSSLKLFSAGLALRGPSWPHRLRRLRLRAHPVPPPEAEFPIIDFVVGRK